MEGEGGGCLCWDEKIVGKNEAGMNEACYASRCVVILVQMILLCVGLSLTPVRVYLRRQLEHSLDSL